MTDDGASQNELLLAAAKQDSDDLLNEVLESGDYDLNHVDAIGNTALHYAAQHGSFGVVEILLDQEGTDVDIQNRLEGDTPLHKAVQYQDDPDVQLQIVDSLIEAGADPRIQNKNRQKPVDLVSPDNTELATLLRKAAAAFNVDDRDFANEDDDDEDDDDDDEPSDQD